MSRISHKSMSADTAFFEKLLSLYRGLRPLSTLTNSPGGGRVVAERSIAIAAREIYMRRNITMRNNLFDNDDFFERYKSARTKSISYNNLLEQPAMKSLLPDLKNKIVLDMGCGFGFSCVEFRKKGAAKVIGIDISEKMLHAARSQNTDENLQFLHLDIEKINELGLTFDVVYSSMTMHYIVDFEKIVKKVYEVLNNKGVFLFSQDHPICTASLEGPTWIENEQGVKTAAAISNYLKNGERNVDWMNQSVVKYHRSFSAIMNTLVEHGFSVLKVVEPMPTEQVLQLAPHMCDEMHRPTAIIIQAQKT